MTRKQKAMDIGLDFRAYQELLELINEGWEYPEAHTSICIKYCLTDEQGKALTDLYDED